MAHAQYPQAPKALEFWGAGPGRRCLPMVTAVCRLGCTAEEEGEDARRLVWFMVTGTEPQTQNRVPSRPHFSSGQLGSQLPVLTSLMRGGV